MDVMVCENHETLSRVAAELVVSTVAWTKNAMLCLSTGRTPTRTCALVQELISERGIDVRALRVRALNEFVGLPANDPGLSGAWLRRHVLDPLKVAPERFAGFTSDAMDMHAECGRMRDHVRDHGPADLAVLGLGANGHLSFNEPGETLAASVHIADLDASTRQHSLLEEAGHVPDKAFTLGIGDLMTSRQVVLLASGANKAEQMRQLMTRDISTRFPASLLWLHPHAICLCDREAHALCRE